MPDWASYAPSDFVMFSARAYYGLFALLNRHLWPLQPVALAWGIAIAVMALRGSPGMPRFATLMLAGAWCGVAWLYFVREYSTIHTYARWFAGAFLLEAVLLAVSAARAETPAPARSTMVIAASLLALALVIQPLLAPMFGRPWVQAELFGLAPDPTVVATFGVMLALGVPWWAWLIPVLWVAYDAMTLRVLRSPEWMVLPLIATIAVFATASLWYASRPPRSTA